jgi:hypothetical protein
LNAPFSLSNERFADVVDFRFFCLVRLFRRCTRAFASGSAAIDIHLRPANRNATAVDSNKTSGTFEGQVFSFDDERRAGLDVNLFRRGKRVTFAHQFLPVTFDFQRLIALDALITLANDIEVAIAFDSFAFVLLDDDVLVLADKHPHKAVCLVELVVLDVLLSIVSDGDRFVVLDKTPAIFFELVRRRVLDPSCPRT